MTHQFYSEWFLNNGVELHPDTEAATTDQILALVKHELGIGFLPEPMAREALNRGEIIEIPLKKKCRPGQSVWSEIRNGRSVWQHRS
ncbi:MAG: LysR substrate-binding domain-containing protein [Lachnospiraceae bacterium]